MTKNPSSLAVEILNVSKYFDDVAAVNNVSLEIKTGEIFALLGGSGCGKTTLLRMLAGFETPTSGDIKIYGESVLAKPPYQRPVNMMFQSYALFPHMSVEQNIAFGLKQDNKSKSEIAARITEVLDLVQMSSFRKRKPDQLSGGQQQRVALARSLAKKPDLLLLDEPMGALDKKLRMQMQLELANIIESVGVTCVMVTHDQEEAMTMADRIAIMGAGQIKQVGKPREVYEYPNSKMTAEFIGSINLFSGTASPASSGHALSCAALDCDLQSSETQRHFNGDCLLALRPEKISLQTEDPKLEQNCVAGVVDDIAYLGSYNVVHVRLPDATVVQVHVSNLARDASQAVDFEQQVYLSWDAAAIVLIDQEPAAVAQ